MTQERPEILRQFDRAVTYRLGAEGLLRTAYEMFLPFSAGGWSGQTSKLEAPAAYVMDGHPMRKTWEDATRISGEIVMNFRQWFRLRRTASSGNPDRDIEIDRALIECEEIIHQRLLSSDALDQILPALMEERISTGVICVHELMAEPYFAIEPIPLSSVFLLPGKHGRISHIFRKWTPKKREIKSLWPAAKLPDDQSIKDDDEVSLIECQGPDPENEGRLIYQVWLEHGGRSTSGPHAILEQDNLVTAPYIAFRSFAQAGVPYGIGSMLLALPDARVANKVAEFNLRSAALTLAPPLQAEDDGVFDPSGFKWQPNQLILVERGSAGVRPIDAGGNLQLGYFVADQMHAAINEAIEPPLPPLGGERKTQTEILVHKARQEAVRVPRKAKLFREMIVPLARRLGDILARKNKLDRKLLGTKAPFDGTVVMVEPATPLDQEYQQVQLQRQVERLQLAMAIDPAETAARVDSAVTVMMLLESAQFPPKAIRVGEAYERKKQEQAEQAQAAQQMALEQQEAGNGRR